VPQQPQQLPVANPVPPVQGNMQSRIAGWNQYLERLTEPGVINSLMTFSMNALTDRAPGQSSLDKGVRAAGEGLNAYTTGTERVRQQGFADREATRKDAAQTEVESRGAETGRHNVEMEAIARERIKSNDAYYSSLAMKAKTAGSLTWDNALTIAQSGMDAQLKSMEELMQTMMEGDPRLEAAQAAYTDLQNNYNARIHQRATGYMGGPSAARPELTSDGLEAARSAGISEDQIRAYTEAQGGEYTPPQLGITPEENAEIDAAAGTLPVAPAEPAGPPEPPGLFDKPGVEGGIFDQKRSNSAALVEQGTILSAPDLQLFIQKHRGDLTSGDLNRLTDILNSKF
jgi:hypothetical protein